MRVKKGSRVIAKLGSVEKPATVLKSEDGVATIRYWNKTSKRTVTGKIKTKYLTKGW